MNNDYIEFLNKELSGKTINGVFKSLLKLNLGEIAFSTSFGLEDQVIDEFQRYKPADYPVAIIQNGTTAAEKTIVGSLENIIERVEEHQIGNPANIIFGHAVTDQVVHFKHLKSVECVN